MIHRRARARPTFARQERARLSSADNRPGVQVLRVGRYAVNPAGSMRQIAPDWNIPETERMPPGSLSRITPSTMALQAAGGDPAKALGLMGYPRGQGAGDMTTTSTYEPVGPGGQPWDPTSLDAMLSGGRAPGHKTTTVKKRALTGAGGGMPSGAGGMSDDERQLRKELGLGG